MKISGKQLNPINETSSDSTPFKPMSEFAMKTTRGGDPGGDPEGEGQGEDGGSGTGDGGDDGYQGGPEGYTPGVLYPMDGGIWFNGKFYTFPYEDLPIDELPDPVDPGSESGNAAGPEGSTGSEHAIYTGGETDFPIGKIVPVDDGVWFNGEHYSWPFNDFPFSELSEDGVGIYDPGNDPLDGTAPIAALETDTIQDAWDDGNIGPEGSSEFFALLFEAGFELVIDAPIDDV